ncbi:hypothetical protein [Nocardia sp. NPDC058633]|uniref:hypothetical protein n=1 Tax=Nocardia sp. NPDC058633 TaxID=3346568 RepID=UPI00365E024A
MRIVERVHPARPELAAVSVIRHAPTCSRAALHHSHTLDEVERFVASVAGIAEYGR